MANSLRKDAFNRLSKKVKDTPKTEPEKSATDKSKPPVKKEIGFERIADNYMERAHAKEDDNNVVKLMRMKSKFMKEKIKEQDNAAQRQIVANQSVGRHGTQKDVMDTSVQNDKAMRDLESKYKRDAKRLYNQDLTIKKDFAKAKEENVKTFLKKNKQKVKTAEKTQDNLKNNVKQRYNMAAQPKKKPPVPNISDKVHKSPDKTATKTFEKSAKQKDNGLDMAV